MNIVPLSPEHLEQLEPFWSTPPWDERAGELRAIAAQASRPSSSEHRGLCALARDQSIAAVALYRGVAGTVGTGEIECVAPVGTEAAAALLQETLARLGSRGARLIVAELPGSQPWRAWREFLESAGFREKASVADYFAEGVPLRILAL